MYLSTNYGTNWAQLYDGLLNIASVYSLAVSGTNIMAGTIYGGIFLSTNNGASWTQVNNSLPNTFIRSLIACGTNFIAGLTEGVYISTNNGKYWTPVNNGLTNNFVNALSVSGINIFAGTAGAGIWRRPLSELVGVTKEVKDLPQEFTLSQNYPNPFNPFTTIKYSLPKAGNVKLTVYNAIGSKVTTIVDEYKTAGNYSVQFNGSNLASGIYLCRLESGSFSAAMKLTLMK